MRVIVKLRYLFWALSCCLTVSPLYAQFFISPYAKAYSLALRLQVDSARLLTQSPQSLPELEAQRLLVQSLADVLENMIVDSDEPRKGYFDRQQARIDFLDDLDNPGPWARHALAECYLHKSMSQGRYGSEGAAMLTAIKAYRKTQSLVGDEPNFLPALKNSGMIDVFIGYGQTDPPLWMRLMGKADAFDDGIEALQKASDTPNAQQAEALLIYALIEAARDNDQRAINKMERYVAPHPDDRLGLSILANMYKEAGQQAKALATIQRARYAPRQLPFHYPLLLEGELHLQNLNADSAIPKLERFLTVCSGKRFVKDLHYQLFIAYFLKGDSLTANRHFYAIRTEGSVGTSRDRYAIKFAERGLIPNRQLLKARLLFDGGFYQRALAVLDSIRPERLRNHYETTELSYRRGRISQKLGDVEKAQRLFQLTVVEGGDDPSYFAPKACLELGVIAYNQGKKDQAKDWFEQVLTYKKHEYEQTLNLEAKQWLKKLDD